MFVELDVKNRGEELFHIGGILRVVRASEHSRIHLFGMAQPVDINETYEDVKTKLLGPQTIGLDELAQAVKNDPEVP